MRVVAPVTGTSREVSDVPDPVFSSGMVGSGLAIDPVASAQTAVAPVSSTAGFKRLSRASRALGAS